MTGGAVEAGLRSARIVDLLARWPGESVWTGAAVLIGCGVLAGTAVLARLVGAAVVEVLIAQNATPVGVADTLPTGAVAVAVLAARIGGALVAQFTPPAGPALALARHVAVAVNGMAALLAHSCRTDKRNNVNFWPFLSKSLYLSTRLYSIRIFLRNHCYYNI